MHFDSFKSYCFQWREFNKAIIPRVELFSHYLCGNTRKGITSMRNGTGVTPPNLTHGTVNFWRLWWWLATVSFGHSPTPSKTSSAWSQNEPRKVSPAQRTMQQKWKIGKEDKWRRGPSSARWAFLSDAFITGQK